jgi:sugar phosphate permease
MNPASNPQYRPLTPPERRRHFRLPAIPRRYAIFLVVSLAMGMMGFQRMGLSAVAAALMSQYGLDAGQLGALGSAYFYVYGAMQFPAGVIIDRWGARRIMPFLFAVATIGGVIFALAPNFGWLIAGRTLVGLGVSVIFIGSLKLLAAWFPTKDLALWNGLFLALGDLAVLGTGRPLVEISRRIGWSNAFLIVAGLCGITTLLLWLVVRDEPAREWERGLRISARPPTASRAELMEVLRSPIVWVMGLGIFFTAGTQASMQATWAGPYLTDVYALAPAVMGNLLTLIPFGRMTGNLVHGWIADRVFHSRAALVTLGLGLFAACWIPLALWPAGFSVGALAGTLYGGFGVSYVTLLLVFPILRTRFSGRVAATANGIVNSGSIFGIAIMQQVTGWLVNQYAPTGGHYPVASYRLMFSVGLVLSVVGWLVTSASAWWAGRKQATN